MKTNSLNIMKIHHPNIKADIGIMNFHCNDLPIQKEDIGMVHIHYTGIIQSLCKIIMLIYKKITYTEKEFSLLTAQACF